MATKDQIIALPRAELRQRSHKVSVIDDDVRQIIEDMESATLDWEAERPHEVGVALAAVQIDKPYRVVVIRNNLENKDDRTFSVFINPEIVKLEGEIEADYEGCLSVPDIYGKVPRNSKVRVKATDENGREVRVRAEGFLARVFQHEIDHTKGIMFVDHIRDDAEAFYRLGEDGKLINVDYENVSQTGIFRN